MKTSCLGYSTPSQIFWFEHFGDPKLLLTTTRCDNHPHAMACGSISHTKQLHNDMHL